MKKIYLLIAVSFLLCSTIFGQSKAQRLILFEEFTNASCAPCAATNPGLNAILHNPSNESKIISIKYQANFPGSDPMNAQNPTQVSTRLTYYGVEGVPDGYMDGNVFADHPGYFSQTNIDNEYPVSAPFTISLVHSISSGLDSVYIDVTVTAETATSGTLKLHNVMIEREIYFATAPGSNGETEFYDVMRKMIPSDQGETLPTSFTAGQTATFHYAVPIPTYIYNKNQLAIVSFIQDNANKNVKQAAYSQPIPVTPDAAIMSVSNVPAMQCNTTFDPGFVFKNTGSTTITSATIAYKIDNNAATNYTWTGSLATNASEAITLPTITGTTGSHTFTVSVTEFNGSPDNFTANNSKTVPFIIFGSSATAPLTESFLTTTFPPANWSRYNPDGGLTWSRAAAGAASTVGSAKIDFYNITDGNIDDLILPPIDLTNIADATLLFHLAHAQYSTSYSDRLQVQASADCGTTWTTVFDKAGATLATTTVTTSAYTPTAAHWRAETANLSAFDGTNNVLVRFHAISGYGNNAYVDQINITSITAIKNNAAAPKNIMVYPNPTDGLIYIYNADNSEISLYNILGKQVLTVSKATNVNTLDLSGLPQGNYFVKISNGKEVVTKKVVLTK
ncbi:MAG: hypothetical protein A2275_07925 [Bacteroidetes bacterium RIFOXYA12_FULL_35_11]|nr:MAG: hypothetical protein A2X01_11850 [Bacteroidetes bacterium GWF2_35_48]OFY75411.1 MAG: hypothetical protein A2275_07925 [Bacteroidetes bacterium RIFOXYA12_FULL_35_11]HBX52565.1 hypothetical protein [Bacteroidales bacterium]